MGLHIFNGLSPSTRIENKFYPQRQDEFHGNDFVYNSFGPNSERRHRHFKKILPFQNPVIKTPSRSVYPNWKMRPIFKWMDSIFREVLMLGITYSVKEMIMRFQGLHKDKIIITYKRKGDGFQCNALCQDGFCYQFYFRNHPDPSKYLKQGISPLHEKVMNIFDSTKDKFHICGMDNLCNLALLCKRSFIHKMKFMIYGVTRTGMREIPYAIKQEEVENRRGETRSPRYCEG